MNKPMHGGDIDVVSKIYGIDKQKIIDFSVNVNPLGVSDKVKAHIANNLDRLNTYPDANYKNMKSRIASYIKTDVDKIAVGNGVAELNSLYINFAKPKRALVVAPAYSEYKKEILKCGGECIYHELTEESGYSFNSEKLISQASQQAIDIIVICNPCNPTGKAIPKEDIEQLLVKLGEIPILIDETYMEFSDEHKFSSISLTEKYSNLFVTRGASKFFALTGLRLGYGVCGDKRVIHEISERQSLCSINIVADIAAEIAFDDTDYIEQSKALINSERQRVCDELKKWDGIKVYDTDCNFVLIKLLNKNCNATHIFESLIKKHMYVRDASNIEFLGDRYLRICFLLPHQNSLLLTELKKLLTV